ncbi:hypothetical protein ACHAWF_011231 [Thalassiosira exigua]
MRAEDLKEWLRGIVEEEDPEKDGREGAGDRWRLFVRLVRAIWEKGHIPRQLLWVVVVLLPKGGGDYRGIGLLEQIWKVIEGVIDTRLKVIELHNCLHGYLAKRGFGTATVEAKFAAQLAYLEQEPFFSILFDLRKVFDAMDRGRWLRILLGYGVGPKTLLLIKLFWTLTETSFGASHRLTQGGPFLPKRFNILVDAIGGKWLMVLFGNDTALGLDEEMLRVLMALFCAYDGFIASRDADLLQEASDVLVGLVDCVGFVCNTTKMKALTFVPGKIRTHPSVSSYQRRFELGTRPSWMSRCVE